MAATVILSLALGPSNVVQTERHDLGDVSSMQKSWEITQGEYSVRSLQTLAEISQDSTVDNFREGLENLTRRGTLDGEKQQDVNFEDWRAEMKQLSGNLDSASVNKINISVENLTVSTSSETVLEYPQTQVAYTAEHETNVSGVEDVLLDSIGYDTEIDPCRYTDLAVEGPEGAVTSGTSRGYPLIEPDDPSSELEPESHIIITSDITSYNNSTTANFAGYISENEPGQPSDYNSNYVIGTSSLPSFEDDQTAIIHQGVWKSNFERTIKDECFLSSGLQNTPSIEERMREEANGSSNQGIFTVLNASEVSTSDSDSNIGYERIDSSGRELVSIEGVSTGDGITWSYFRMSRELAEAKGASGLIH